jgi:hypothetical protein
LEVVPFDDLVVAITAPFGGDRGGQNGFEKTWLRDALAVDPLAFPLK